MGKGVGEGEGEGEGDSHGLRGDWATRELQRVRATTSQSIERRPVNHLHCSVLSLEGRRIGPRACVCTRSAQGIARARAIEREPEQLLKRLTLSSDLI